MKRGNQIFVAVFVAIISTITMWPTLAEAESEPFTLAVCQRETSEIELKKCIDDLINMHEGDIAFAIMRVRNKLHAKDSVRAFDDAQTAWFNFIDKECFSASLQAPKGRDALITNANCYIANIDMRIDNIAKNWQKY